MIKIKRPDLLSAGGAFLVVAVMMILILTYAFNFTIKEAMSIAGSILTALSVFLAFIAIRDTHEWNRRRFTIDLTKDWNVEAREHIAYLSVKFPRYFEVPDFIGDPKEKVFWCIDNCANDQFMIPRI